MIVKKTLRRIANTLSGQRKARKTLRKEVLTKQNYKTLRRIEKTNTLSDANKTLRNALLTKAKINNTKLQTLLTKRSRLRKYFNKFITEAYKEETPTKILNVNLPFFKRMKQKIKNKFRTLREKNYTPTQKTASTKPFSIPQSRSPLVGIKNPNLACFINTSLQMLYRIDSFRKGVLTIRDKSLVRKEPIKTLQQIFLFMSLAEFNQVSPIDIHTTSIKNREFECLAEQAHRARQSCDMDEFLNMCMFPKIENLHLNNLFNIFKFNMQKKQVGYYNPATRDGGQSGVVDKGIRGGFKIKEYLEPLYPLTTFKVGLGTLPQNKNNVGELQNLIDSNMIEIPDRNNLAESLKIDNQHPIMEKSCTTYTFPKALEYLIVTLNRFAFDVASMQASKINNSIKINKYILINGEIFEIEGVGNHSGSTRGGHYWYYWYNRKSNTWYELNDSIVRVLNLKNQNSGFISFAGKDVEEEGYVLLYKRSNISQSAYLTYRNNTNQYLRGITLLPLLTL